MTQVRNGSRVRLVESKIAANVGKCGRVGLPFHGHPKLEQSHGPLWHVEFDEPMTTLVMQYGVNHEEPGSSRFVVVEEKNLEVVDEEAT